MASSDMLGFVREVGFPASLALIMLYFFLTSWTAYREQVEKLTRMMYEQNEKIITLLENQGEVLREISREIGNDKGNERVMSALARHEELLRRVLDELRTVYRNGGRSGK